MQAAGWRPGLFSERLENKSTALEAAAFPTCVGVHQSAPRHPQPPQHCIAILGLADCRHAGDAKPSKGGLSGPPLRAMGGVLHRGSQARLQVAAAHGRRSSHASKWSLPLTDVEVDRHLVDVIGPLRNQALQLHDPAVD